MFLVLQEGVVQVQIQEAIVIQSVNEMNVAGGQKLSLGCNFEEHHGHETGAACIWIWEMPDSNAQKII